MAKNDFWTASGWHLLHVNEDGDLEVTADFLRAYFIRLEMMPEETSSEAEITLHNALKNDPLKTVSAEELAGLDDEDVAHNYQVVLAFRDLLVTCGTLEAAYLKIARGSAGVLLPKIFIDQMAHAILRQILDEVEDPIRLRAAELFFREQNVSTADGRVMLADEETVEMYAETGGMGGLGQLLTQSATPTRQIELDVLDEDNGQIYWDRSGRFDTVVDFRFTQPAVDGFARVIEAWIWHFVKIGVAVQPVQRIDDEHWRWHIGLDGEATRILNALYNGEEPRLDEQAQLIALFAMQIKDQNVVMETARARPIYLGLAINGSGKLQMKPQNLLVNLPLEKPA